MAPWGHVPGRGFPARAALVLASLLLASQASAADFVDVAVPPYDITGEAYLCVQVQLPERPLRLVAIDPLSEEQLVHHMLLYGCVTPGNDQPVWECMGHSVCGPDGQQILYGWGKNAPPMALPEGVGFQVGEGSAARSLVLQVHFVGPRPAKDTSGVRLTLTPDRTPFLAGMMMYASTFHIPPGRKSTLVANRCCLAGFQPAHGFAFRVHTHQLGRSVFQDRVLPSGAEQRVVEHSPQLPQGFTPVTNITFWPGDQLTATCDFESTGLTHGVSAGGTHKDEMCNLYFMLWSELPIFYTCFNSDTTFDRHGAGGIPASADVAPEHPKNWHLPPVGQVSGVTQGADGTLWVLHRANRVWDANSFTPSKPELTTYTEGIAEDTVYRIDQDTGELMGYWGAGQLFMPHMITADREGNVWVTDAAAHVALKYTPEGKELLRLGTPNKPGSGPRNFCKPTDVAVGSSGSVYVSDGYCNHRVAEFHANGTHAGDFEGGLQTPHALALDECRSRLYVASRESKEIVLFDLATRKETGRWDLARQGYVYDIAVGPYDVLFALCWDRDAPGSPTRLVQLVPDFEPAVDGRRGQWDLPDVKAPHSLTLTAAPVRLAEKNRPLALLVGETQPQDSRLHKFILVPAGEVLPPDVPGQIFPSAAQSYAAMAASVAVASANSSTAVLASSNHTQASLEQPAHSHVQQGHHHTHHHVRTLLQDLSWDADRAASARLRSFLAVTPKGLHGHVHTAAHSLHGLAGQVQSWIGSGGEWLAWLLYGGGGMDAEDEDLRSGLGPSLKHASIVGLPLCLLILAMAGALWHLAGKEQ